MHSPKQGVTAQWFQIELSSKNVKRTIIKAMTYMNNELNEASEPNKETFLDIICPCHCGRAVPLIRTSYSGDISELANQIWRQLASEKGLEGAIEFLHKSDKLG